MRSWRATCTAGRGIRSCKPVTISNFGQSRCVATEPRRFKLNTGASIPSIGFGTFQDPEAQEDAVSRALRAGLRLIDTAKVYHVEKQVGKGLKASGVPREEVFLGTKLWCNSYHPEDVESALDQSLQDLDTPYVDLLMMHYPVTFKRGVDEFPRDENGKMLLGETTYLATWRAMEKLVTKGKVKAIGVSNFSRGELETLIRESSTVSPGARRPLSHMQTTRPLTRTHRYPQCTRWKCTRTSNKGHSTPGSARRAYTLCNSAHWAT